MLRSPHQDSRPNRVRQAALGVLIALVLATVTLADDLGGRAIISWRQFDDELATSSGYSQDYDLWYNRAVSESLRYRIRFGAEMADNSFDAAGEDRDSEFREYEAVGELLFSLPKLRFRTNYEGFNTFFENGQSDSRDLGRGTAQLDWLPDLMPNLSLWADRRHVNNDARDDEMTELILQATIFEDLGPWSLSGTARTNQVDDEFGEVRDTDDLLGNVSFTDSFYDGRLSTSARLFLLDSARRERTGFVGDIPGRRLVIERLLAVIDPTPDDARDVTPNPEPLLIDNQFSPTGIALGPAGQSFLNVALDMGRLVRMDRIFLYVRDPSGNPILTGGPLDWSAYVSDNELDWVRLTAGVRSRFDPTRSLYEVTVPGVSTRFIKVVNFGLNVVDTDLVEVEAFEAGNTVSGEDFETEQRLGTLEGSISARPADWSQLSWSGRWNTSVRTPEGGSDERTDDSYHLVSARFDTADWSDLLLNYQHREEKQPGGFQRDFDQFTTEVGFLPREGIDLRLQAYTSRDRAQDSRIDTDGLILRTQTLLWRALDLRLDLGQEWSDQQVPFTQDVTRRFANFWTIWQMNNQVQMTATLTTSRDDIEAPGIVLDMVQDNYRWWVETYWRPGPPLALTARLGNAGGEDFSADIRRYQVQWNPFRGGSLAIGMVYDEDVDTDANRTFRRLLLTPSWRLNPHARLQADYTRTESSGAGAVKQRVESVLVSLTLNL